MKLLLDIFQTIERLPRFNPVKKKTGKRKNHDLHSNTMTVKNSKIDDCDERTEQTGMTRDEKSSEGMMTEIFPKKQLNQAESTHYMTTNVEDIQLFPFSQG